MVVPATKFALAGNYYNSSAKLAGFECPNAA
jgi:hypothetical protein